MVEFLGLVADKYEMLQMDLSPCMLARIILEQHLLHSGSLSASGKISFCFNTVSMNLLHNFNCEIHMNDVVCLSMSTYSKIQAPKITPSWFLLFCKLKYYLKTFWGYGIIWLLHPDHCCVNEQWPKTACITDRASLC